MFLNLFIDLIPKSNGTNTACKCTKNKIEKNKLIYELKLITILIRNILYNYLRREIYQLITTIISIVRTNGNAGYLVWKSAGGQGDHDISLPFVLFDEVKTFFFFVVSVFVANPLLISKSKFNINKNKKK